MRKEGDRGEEKTKRTREREDGIQEETGEEAINVRKREEKREV